MRGREKTTKTSPTPTPPTANLHIAVHSDAFLNQVHEVRQHPAQQKEDEVHEHKLFRAAEVGQIQHDDGPHLGGVRKWGPCSSDGVGSRSKRLPGTAPNVQFF
jgi:hypothetical protein